MNVLETTSNAVGNFVNLKLIGLNWGNWTLREWSSHDTVNDVGRTIFIDSAENESDGLRDATVRFNYVGRVSGESFCNGYVGTYSIAGSEIRIEGFGTSFRGCNSELADEYFQALAASETWGVNDAGELTIAYEEEETSGILKFAPDFHILMGTSASETLTGENQRNLILAEDGDDLLNGQSNSDRLYGGKGEDTIRGSDGEDTLGGGEDNDLILGENDKDKLNGNQGNDSLNGGNRGDDLLGGSGDDLLEGGNGFDILQGGVGNDTLNGDNGRDTLLGGGGNDYLIGGGFDSLFIEGNASITKLERRYRRSDRLFGGDGNDTLDGGNSNTVMFGGSGADQFWFIEPFPSLDDSIPPDELLNPKVDVIADFDPNQDLIAIDSNLDTKLTPGVISEDQFIIGSAPFTSNQHFIYEFSADSNSGQAEGLLWFDSNGSQPGGTITNIARLLDFPDLNADHLLII